MDPKRKIEHLLIPEIGVAFTTTNKWHDLEPWEIYTGEKRIVVKSSMIDINDYLSAYYAEKNAGILEAVKTLQYDAE